MQVLMCCRKCIFYGHGITVDKLAHYFIELFRGDHREPWMISDNGVVLQGGHTFDSHFEQHRLDPRRLAANDKDVTS